MTAVRQDAWSPDDDLILAEVTLRHIREGGTQLKAFEEVGERIGRTAAACGFRWNSCVRKRYEEAIRLAKAERHKRNKKGSGQDTGGENEGTRSAAAGREGELSIDRIIRFLRQWKTEQSNLQRQIKQLEKELKEKQEELEALRSENESLKAQVQDAKSDYQVINEDYKALIQIMDRARKLAFLAEEEEETRPRFKMDANGNLERIE
jgi:prespore-specific regulator